MSRSVLALAALTLLSFGVDAFAEGDARRGAQAYRACVACHALEPSLHLSGPSLDGFMGRMAGTAEGFVRFSPGLKDAGFSWNAAALDGWLKDPMGMIPGTYMMFRGIDDPQARADLVGRAAQADLFTMEVPPLRLSRAPVMSKPGRFSGLHSHELPPNSE